MLDLQKLEGNTVKYSVNKYLLASLAFLCVTASPVNAQYGGGEGSPSSTEGESAAAGSGSKEFFSYVDVMFSYQLDETDDEFVLTEGGGLLGGGSSTDIDPLDKSMGFNVLAGFRRQGWYGFEFGLGYSKDGDSDVQKQSALFNTLIYPFESSELYLKIATGVTRYVEYPIERSPFPIADGDDDFTTINYGAGVGYVFPMQVGESSFGIRAEAVYLIGDRFLERESDFEEDIRAPGTLEAVHFNVGLRFPL